MSITLRPHQLGAADAVENAYRRGVMRPLADMCVASGKSLFFAELARRALLRGERSIIAAHTRELVDQNAKACRLLMPGVHVGINAAALGERTYRAPIICVAIQSVYNDARNFGDVGNVMTDEAHLVPHSESGMYRKFHRGFPGARFPGGSGTVFRLQGGSLVEGEEAPYDEVVYRYTIADGIRDGYLCPAWSLTADDKMDASKLRVRNGEYRSDEQDAQMIAAMDNHIAQMVHHGWQDRRAWLIFEASTKSARLMAERMNAWGIPTGLVLGDTPDGERAASIEAYRAGRLRALVNIQALTTGFDVPHVDLLVFRRRTKSLGLYIQMAGRLLRTIGGNIAASVAAGKSDGAVLDFAGNIDQHGPLDFIRPKETRARLVACDECGTRNAGAAVKCWHCDALMLKNCPACLNAVPKHELDCRHCGHDMRRQESGERKEQALLKVPTGAALLSSYKAGTERTGGWLPIRRSWQDEVTRETIADTSDGARYLVAAPLAERVVDARWLRAEGGQIVALLCPNGRSLSSARQVSADGSEMIVPLPAVAEAAA